MSEQVQIMKNSRVAWLDYMSGIGTLMVFMQHSCVPVITRIILGFHMPLFFWISGFLYQQNKSFNKLFGMYIKSRITRLLVPYLFWFAIGKGQAFLMRGVDQPFVFVQEVLKSFLYCSSWFLPCLFLSEIIFHLINQKIARTVGTKCTVMSLCAILFWVLSWGENLINPERGILCFDTCLMAIGFMFAGAMSVHIVQVIKEQKFVFSIVEMIVMTTIGILCVIQNGKNNANFMMYQNQYGNYIYAIVGALSLIFSLYLAVNIFEKFLPKQYLQYLRDNGIVLFLIHISIISMIKELIPALNSVSMWISSIVCLIAIHVIGFPVGYVVNKYVPVLAGKRK